MHLRQYTSIALYFKTGVQYMEHKCTFHVHDAKCRYLITTIQWNFCFPHSNQIYEVLVVLNGSACLRHIITGSLKSDCLERAEKNLFFVVLGKCCLLALLANYFPFSASKSGICTKSRKCTWS